MLIMQKGQLQARGPAWALFALLAKPWPGTANKAFYCIEGGEKENDSHQMSQMEKNQVQVPAPS